MDTVKEYIKQSNGYSQGTYQTVEWIQSRNILNSLMDIVKEYIKQSKGYRQGK